VSPARNARRSESSEIRYRAASPGASHGDAPECGVVDGGERARRDHGEVVLEVHTVDRAREVLGSRSRVAVEERSAGARDEAVHGEAEGVRGAGDLEQHGVEPPGTRRVRPAPDGDEVAEVVPGGVEDVVECGVEGVPPRGHERRPAVRPARHEPGLAGGGRRPRAVARVGEAGPFEQRQAVRHDLGVGSGAFAERLRERGPDAALHEFSDGSIGHGAQELGEHGHRREGVLRAGRAGACLVEGLGWRTGVVEVIRASGQSGDVRVRGQTGRDRVVDAALLVGEAERHRRGEVVSRPGSVTEREERRTGKVLDGGVDRVVGAECLGEVEEVRDAQRTGLGEHRRGESPGHDESFEGIVWHRPEPGGEVCGGRHRPPRSSRAGLSAPSGSLAPCASR
jgi:hypothetical protein